MYSLSYNGRALKKLKKIHPLDQKKVLSKLKLLVTNPTEPSLDIKKLENAKRSFRLRVGNVRVIFEIENKTRSIYIMDVNYRGSIGY